MSSLARTLLVITRGGVVDEVLCMGAIRATVVDYDAEGEEDAVLIPQRVGRARPAIVSEDVQVENADRVKEMIRVLPTPEDDGKAHGDATPGQAQAMIVVEGGVVQNVVTDRPLHLILVDHDIDGLDEDEEAELVTLPRGRAMADWSSVEVDPAEVHRMQALCSAQG